MDMLFAAFEKHQYYNIKDLVKITNQPVVSYCYQILYCLCLLNHSFSICLYFISCISTRHI